LDHPKNAMNFILFWDVPIQNKRAGIESDITCSQNNFAINGSLILVRRFIGEKIGSRDLFIVDHLQSGRASHDGHCCRG
jgi:hypothetical protein